MRQLYTDDEVLFQAARPLLVNSIEDIISRADLADRGIFLTLAPIGEHQRRLEAELLSEFEIAQPRIRPEPRLTVPSAPSALSARFVTGMPSTRTTRVRASVKQVSDADDADALALSRGQ
jgi:hypothetical protein